MSSFLPIDGSKGMTGSLNVTGNISSISGNGKTTTQITPTTMFRKISGVTSYNVGWPTKEGTFALVSDIDDKVELKPEYGDPVFSKWTCDPSDTGGEYPEQYFVEWDTIPDTEDQTWCLFTGIEGDSDFVTVANADPDDPNIRNLTELTFNIPEGGTLSATRTRTDILIGYSINDQDSKLLQPAGDYATKQEVQRAQNAAELASMDASAALDNANEALSQLGYISDVIPFDASPANKLASEDFVNSSVATNTATYQGAYNLVGDLNLTTAATHQQI